MMKPSSTVATIVSNTRHAIQTGRIALGQRLVEADMARDHGVSRGAVREALHALSGQGVVDIVPNRGAVVRPLSRKDLADRFVIRERLEGLAAALTAERLHEGDNRARFLSAAEPSDQREPVRLEEHRRQNYALHGSIAELSGNPQLAELIARMWIPPVMVELRRSLDRAFFQDSARDHRRIIRAILAQKPAAAETAMRDHLRNRCKALLELPSEVFGF